MATNNKVRLMAYHAALNAFDSDKVAGFFASDAEYCSPGIKGCLTGRDQIMKAFRAYFTEFADQIAVDDSIVELTSNQFRSDWHLTATSKLSGRRVNRRGSEHVTFNKAGLITFIEVADA
jgi:ketosteroid isomerase-like protein